MLLKLFVYGIPLSVGLGRMLFVFVFIILLLDYILAGVVVAFGGGERYEVISRVLADADAEGAD